MAVSVARKLMGMFDERAGAFRLLVLLELPEVVLNIDGMERWS